MAKQYIQKAETFFSYSNGSMAADAASSASILCAGFAKFRGLFYSDVITETGSGLQVQFSPDAGTTWTYTSASDVVAACGGAACAYDVVGDAVKVTIRNGGTAASNARWKFYLLPV